MIGTEIWKLVNRRPFEPFTIRMADGRSFRVGHPEAVVPSFLGRTVLVYDKASGGASILDLFLMTELESPESDHVPNELPKDRNGAT